MKRRAVVAAVLAIAVLAVAGRAPAPAQPLRSFLVTEPVHSLDSVPFYLAVRKGFFKELGLDVKLVTSEGGGRHISAVISGDAHAFIGGPEHMAFARVKGGKYVRPIAMGLMKVPFLKRWLTKASKANLERKNPELASAIAKLERSGVQNDPQRAQAAMSRLSAAERRAYLDAAGAEGAIPEPMNRQQRRQAQKLKKRR